MAGAFVDRRAGRGAALALGATVAVLLLLLLAGAVAWLPAFPCPSCIDLDLFVPGCSCGGRPRSPQKLSLWKRWQLIRELEAEGSRPIPVFKFY